MDEFLFWAGLSSAEHKLLDPYLNKTFEASTFKGIPIQHYDQVRAIIKKTGFKFRTKFRGPRHDYFRATCLKKDAKTFAIYPK